MGQFLHKYILAVIIHLSVTACVKSVLLFFFYYDYMYTFSTAEQKNYIFKQLSGQARKLLTHRVSKYVI
jgi:hypothetical protein